MEQFSLRRVALISPRGAGRGILDRSRGQCGGQLIGLRYSYSHSYSLIVLGNLEIIPTSTGFRTVGNSLNKVRHLIKLMSLKPYLVIR